MNWKTLPPLSSLRAFAAYAQFGSVEKAGAALNVSHAAISQQLRALESHIGLALLDRSGRTMVLTPSGEALAQVSIDGFGQMAQVVDALTGADAGRPLHVACTPSFAANWLMPRLAKFRALHPDTELIINPSPNLTDPSPGGIDVALRYGFGEWSGLQSQHLLPAPLAVVGAPSLFPEGLPSDPRDLLSVPWLQELGTNEATRGMELQGIMGQKPDNVTHVPGNLMIDGLRRGDGIAVTTRIPIEEDIASGRLLIIFEQPDDAAYHIVTAPGVQRPALRDFLLWLRRETKEERPENAANSVKS